MNKKFLSAILFGALMVTSTGTFVSCKDYDDDIDAINKELTDLKSKLDALQTAVDNGKWITSVTTTADGLTITMNDGQTFNITNGEKGEPGAAGDKIVIDDATGAITINGKETGYFAVKNTETGKVTVPTIDKDGFWCLVNEKGELEQTSFKASPINAVQDPETKVWTLKVWNTETKVYDEIKLPTAASMITEAEMLGFLTTHIGKVTSDGYWYPVSDKAELSEVAYDFTIVDDAILNATNAKEWNKESGVKKLVKGQALSTIASMNSNLLIRIAPASVDASEFSFSLINSQMKEAPIVLGTPVAYEGLLTRSAVSGNGLWQIPVSAVEGKTYKDDAAYEAEFEVKGVTSTGKIAFALKEVAGFATNYDLTFSHENLELDANVTKNYNPELNEEMQLEFDSPQNVYDAHIHFAEADVIRWGIVYNGGINFTITKLADQITVPYITATAHYVTLEGEVKKETINIKPSKVNSNLTELAKSTILVKADNDKNNFSASLKPMFDNLGETATTLWRADVAFSTAELHKVKSNDEAKDQLLGTGSGQVVVSYDKTALGEINTIKVQLDANNTLSRFENYYMLITYHDVNGEALSTLKVPFNITIPAITDLLKKEQVVFNGTNNGIGVLNQYDLNTAGDAIYSLKYAFVGQLADAFADGSTVTFGIDANQTIKIDGADVKMNTLVQVKNSSAKTAYIQLIDKKKAYNKDVNMVVSAAKYLNKYAYTADEMKTAAFTMKIVSPIEQGTLEAAGGADAIINVVATEDGKAKVTEADLVAKTYAGVAYKVFKDKFAGTDLTATGWTSPYIKNDAIFKSTNENVFTMGSVIPATRDAKGNVTPGYVVVNPQNVAYEDAVPVKITLKDAWGYEKVVTINVKVSPKK